MSPLILWQVSDVTSLPNCQGKFTIKHSLQPFWIIKYSSSNSSCIVLTFDEMIRLSTWLLHICSLVFMVTHKGLHNGVVCGVHEGVQREGTLSLAIVRCVSFWSDDPVLKKWRRWCEKDVKKHDTFSFIPQVLIISLCSLKRQVQNEMSNESLTPIQALLFVYLPPQVSETDVELMLLTRLLLFSTAVFCEKGKKEI